MAGQIPLPRSYPSLLGDQIDAFISRYGVRGLKVGGPILSMMEAAAQSDLRSSQDIFNLLDADNLDRAVGTALDRHAADEDTARQPVTASSGKVNFFDSSITKIATKVYPGTSAPNAGTSTLVVSDASLFPSTGGVYIGRGTGNFEGPIRYSNPTSVGSYWTISLNTPTGRFHDVNETVVLAQGGNRTIPAGQIVQTPQGNVSTAVSFSTLYSATIPDGESEVDDVVVVCQTPGIVGNVHLGGINTVVGNPFNGVGVTNPLPFDNGLAAEDDNALRERIKNLRQSRSKGTALALITNAQGVTAKDENKTVVSASLISLKGEPATLFVDDGTGYEERSTGIALETLMDQAVGGENHFTLSGGRPVSKASVMSNTVAPFTLQAGATLAVKVAGVVSQHTFDLSSFRSITNATSYEVVSSINSDPNISFSARTANSGANVVLFARTETSEDLEVVAPTTGVDSNSALGFTKGLNYTLRLYQNDRLLSKDGQSAVVTSLPQSAWSNSMSTGIQLTVQIDGTPAVTYTFTDADFVTAGTGYATLASTNSLDSWAAVFNAKIPGLTAVSSGGTLLLTSNRGTSKVAAIVLSQPPGVSNNLINKGMFSATAASSFGKANDFIFDRNTGQLKLMKPLATNDALSAGTAFTRAYLQGAAVTGAVLSLNAGGGVLYVSVDGAAQNVATGLNASVTVAVSDQGNGRARYTASTNNIFGNPTTLGYIQSGDWFVAWDPALTQHGVWRVASVDTTNWAWFEVEHGAIAAQSATALTKNGMTFVRTASSVQAIRVSGGTNRSLLAIASEINTGLRGAFASVYRNVKLRLTTDTFGNEGDIFLAAADVEAQKLLLPAGTLTTNSASHLAAVESGNPELGTPLFGIDTIASVVNGTTFTAVTSPPASGIKPGLLLGWSRRYPSTYETYGANVGQHSSVLGLDVSNNITLEPKNAQYVLTAGNLARVASTVTGVITSGHKFKVGDLIQVWPGEANFAAGAKTVTAVTATTFSYSESGSTTSSTLSQNVIVDQGLVVGDRFYAASPFAIAPDDTLNVVLDGQLTTRNYALTMGRKIKPAPGAVYSASGFGVIDVDNGGAALSTAFGTGTPNFFADYALWMHSRTKSHANDTTKCLLWRYTRIGPAGNHATVEYVNPSAPSQSIGLTTSNGQFNKIFVSLPSGAARTGLNLQNTTKFTASVSTSGVTDSVTYTYSKPIIASGGLTRSSGIVTATTSTPHGFAVGDTVYLTSSDANFAAGAKSVTGVTSTTFTYVEGGLSISSTLGTSVSSASVDATLGGLTVGDIVNFGVGSALPASHLGSWRTSAVTSTSFTVLRATGIVSAITTPVSIVSTNYLRFYPINVAAATAALIATWVNANAASLVTATVINGGATQITTSTLDEYLTTTTNSTGASVANWGFVDGINYVQSSNLAASPSTLTLSRPVTSDLTSGADFANEDMRLVPVTTAALVNYLSSPAVSGFYSSSGITAAAQAGKLQLSSNTVGSAGSVQVTGGTANSTTVAMSGAGQIVDTTFSKVTVLDAQTQGLIGNRWVAVQAATVMPKSTPWASADTVTISAGPSATSWLVTFTQPVWTLKQTIALSVSHTGFPATVRISKQGRFVAYTLGSFYPISGSVGEGDWVNITGMGAQAANTGLFLVVRKSADGQTFWVENPNGVEDTGTLDLAGSMFFYSYDSVQPGDTFVIDTTALGATNKGSYTVNALGGSSASFYVTGNLVAGSLALTTTAASIRLMEAQPARVIKQIWGIGRNPSNSTYADVVFNTANLASKMSASAGSTLQALDKLAFPTSVVSGADAYQYSTGLIGEVTRVIYGDQSNPSVYPGVVAAGANINTSGPLTRRIQVSLAIRLRTGATDKDILDRVKSAVASQINLVKLGKPVAIGKLVSAAQAVDGVEAVSVISPTYNSGNDIIPVQANEKPRVLDISQDILVSVVGQ